MNFGDLDGDAFRVSLQVTLLATLLCVVVGLPVTWWMWRSRLLAGRVLSVLVLLPLVLPPTVIGYALLYGLGRQSAFGRFLLDDVGLRLIFTWQGAGIAAAIVALPLFVRTALAGFQQVDPDLVDVGRTLGKRGPSLFFRVVFPLAWPSVVAATLIALARSFGEFGATIVVAGNIPGRTQTVPVAIYDAIQAGDTARANALTFAALIAGLLVLAGLSLLLQGRR
jgi:molybdate transport system permease protein